MTALQFVAIKKKKGDYRPCLTGKCTKQDVLGEAGKPA
jgi:hypothetical protein